MRAFPPNNMQSILFIARFFKDKNISFDKCLLIFSDVDKVINIIPHGSYIFPDFANISSTAYPPQLWIKEQLFQTEKFGRLGVHKESLLFYSS